MSHQRIRHIALALTLGLVPLISALPVDATPTPTQAAPMGPPGMSAARIEQIRDGGPPVMREAAQNIDGAPYTAGTIPTTFPPTNPALSNPRVNREAFRF